VLNILANAAINIAEIAKSSTRNCIAILVISNFEKSKVAKIYERIKKQIAKSVSINVVNCLPALYPFATKKKIINNGNTIEKKSL
jgi:predicted amino acid-binding ACT domain protein|uniref:hypothetical protein n=1 Tax=Serratia marcescens TaxID=615 RepID=UPI001F18E602